MICPVCAKPLIVVEYKGIELDYCIHCKGFWFDEGEIRLLSEALKLTTELPDLYSLPAAKVKEKPRKCPRCNKKMDKILIGLDPGILIDRCKKNDGIWLDSGELAQVIEQHLIDKNSGEADLMQFLGETFKA